MASMTSSEHLRASIKSRLAELDHERARLLAALAALNGHQTNQPTPSPSSTPRARVRTRKASNRRAKALAAEGLLKLVTDNPGQTSAALAKLADAEPAQVLTLLKESEAAGSVRRSGRARGTRWTAYTDEDRIAERATELAKQSRKAKPHTAIGSS
jgi:mRNA degradation ribonuclease J1/J2